MDFLPIELFEVIFNFLDYSDKLNYVMVNKQLNRFKLDKPFILISRKCVNQPMYSDPRYFITLNTLESLIKYIRSSIGFEMFVDNYEYYYFCVLIPNRFVVKEKYETDFEIDIYENKIKTWVYQKGDTDLSVSDVINKCYEIYVRKLKI